MSGHQHPQHPQGEAPEDVPFDAANQSLADALRASFRILKLIMIAVAIVFLVSNVKIVDNNEEAVIFRFGKMKLGYDGRPFQPGFLPAFPYPVDEVVELSTKQRNTLELWDHYFQTPEGDRGKPISELARFYAKPLDPARDGALLTADQGLVHVKWTVTYGISDLEKYIRHVADEKDAAQAIITCLLNSTAIQVAANFTVEEITRQRTADMSFQVLREMNTALERLETGLRVDTLEPETTVPMETVAAYANVSIAENQKAAEIQKARKEANNLLTQAAGESHVYLAGLFDLQDAARRDGNEEIAAVLGILIDRVCGGVAMGMTGAGRASEPDSGAAAAAAVPAMPVRTPEAALEYVRQRVEQWVEAKEADRTDEIERLRAEINTDPGLRVSGEAGSRISQARAYYARAVQEIAGDVEVYNAMLEEFRRSPELLINRLWQETWTRLLNSDGVTKYALPSGTEEIRLAVPPDPEQRKIDEINRIMKELEEKKRTG
jgi:regulator of protease activity HflC (stomatin/prohibitin superfamily)